MYIRPRKIGSLPIELTTTILNCRRCKLWQYRKKVVIGQGDIPAKVLFLGEAPSKSDNVTGIPFYGITGEFLKEMIYDAIKLSGLQNTPSYYVTNAILCRPCDIPGGQTRLPLPQEIAMCSPLVNEIIRVVKPKVVIFIGDIAQKFYKKEFPYTAKILPPQYLIKKGGRGCQHYSITIKTLSEIFKGV